MHEASQHEYNVMVNLTYNDENLPEHNSLHHRDIQLFLKKLRKAATPLRGLQARTAPLLGRGKIAYYMCGEYGDENKRPHYHAAIFNLDFSDKTHWRKTETGHNLYRSPALEQLWGKGHAEIGTVTFESAAYIARYVMKKQTGKKAEEHYKRTDKETGEIYQLSPEYNHMSRRPGIGKGWLEKYKTDVYPHGYVIVNGRKATPPRAYEKWHEKTHPDEIEEVKLRKEAETEKRMEDNTRERLAVKEQVKAAQTRQLKRTL